MNSIDYRYYSNKWSTTFIFFNMLCLLASGLAPSADAAAVMSVDLGSEWIKIGVVSPGVPMEIALNRESKRKTPAILAFRDNARIFGEDAVTIGIREPAAAYGYLLDLLGKTIDNPIVDLYRQRFPYYEIIGDPIRNTVIFKRSDTEQYSVEELIAQMLVKSKQFAAESAQQPITECVLTVPGYFGQAEREALLASANLANLKVLQLINDYTGVALNYGVFHRAEINETAQYFIFYDMGAYKTSVAVVSYQLLKDKQTKEINPVVQVLGVGYDRNLGGLEIQLRLRDYLAVEFNAMKKTKSDVTKSPRALAKLFKEAGRLKNVLSANNEHYAQIENLIDDQDFKLSVSREKLEELCADLWPRIAKPLDQAIKSSGLSLDVITQVIIFGGGTRVPKVQDIIKEYIKQDLGKSLNADEAAAMGAVYKAADLATGFKVKKFIVRDSVIFPIQVTFERDANDGTANSVRQVKRVLFGYTNAYPQKKVITFNKHTDDFDFNVHYGDLGHLSDVEISYMGSLNISHVELYKVKELLDKHQKDIVDSKGIKAYFYLDESGIFKCTGIEFIFEKQLIDNENAAGDGDVDDDDESTLAKLGNTITKLFTKDDDSKTKTETVDNDDGVPTKDTNANDNEDKQNDNNNNNNNNNNKEDNNKDNVDDAKTTTTTTNKTDDNKNDNDNKAKDAAAAAAINTPKIVTIKEPLEYKLTLQITSPLSGEAFDESFKKLNEINAAEYERNRLESSFNALESHVIEIQQKLSEDEYTKCATEAEKVKILAECQAISEWLYEDVENPTANLYEKRLNDLKELTNVFLARHWEHNERPEAIKALDGMISAAKTFLKGAKNHTKEISPDKDIFTQVEIDTLADIIEKTNEWKQNEAKAQSKLKNSDEVRMTVKHITDKMSELDREVKYLVNKIKIWKPTVSKKTKKGKSAKKSATTNDKDELNIDEESSGGTSDGDDDDAEAQTATEETKINDETTTSQTNAEEESTPRSDL